MDAKWWPECLRHIRQWQKLGFGRLSATVKLTAPQRHEPLCILDSLPQASSREAWHRGCDVRKSVRYGPQTEVDSAAPLPILSSVFPLRFGRAMRDIFDGMSRTWLLVLAVLSVVGTCLAAASLAALLYVGRYFVHDPKLAVDGANDIPALIYIAAAAFLVLTVGAGVFARGCYLSIRQIAARRP